VLVVNGTNNTVLAAGGRQVFFRLTK